MDGMSGQAPNVRKPLAPDPFWALNFCVKRRMLGAGDEHVVRTRLAEHRVRVGDAEAADELWRDVRRSGAQYTAPVVLEVSGGRRGGRSQESETGDTVGVSHFDCMYSGGTKRSAQSVYLP